jgi:uncharacterized repeat protein (TIGR04138 family)
VRRDPRFKFETYLFLFLVVGRATREERAVTPNRVCRALLAQVIRHHGELARSVLRSWGVNKSEDVGAIVFGLVGTGFLCTTGDDSPDDFRGLMDFDEVFRE